jgi:hypothetical protein
MTSTSWLNYYVANKVDGGRLQTLFLKDQSKLTDLAKGLLEDSDNFFKPFAPVGVQCDHDPQWEPHGVQFLHQGVPTGEGDQILLFAYGNLSESPFSLHHQKPQHW